MSQLCQTCRFTANDPSVIGKCTCIRSTNKHDVYLWIKKVIDSCDTWKQNIACDTLIDIFENKYNAYDLTTKLSIYNLAKFDQISRKQAILNV